ncbi:hypothetical protein N0M98_28560 [Paenibacillus doosanensis]|uniref:hypothetical protein n=1 Tax=Paenibacillus TaxID=44249 RepID=UPI00201DC5EB|nr:MULTISPECIES: hypothetical protein [Paenibacillus]MCS7464068.1 hypothetical protein [Paenibacillus doosanensis]
MEVSVWGLKNGRQLHGGESPLNTGEAGRMIDLKRRRKRRLHTSMTPFAGD